MLEPQLVRHRVFSDNSYRKDEGHNTCRKCHKKLSRVNWSEAKDILKCKNGECALVDQIQKYVKVRNGI